MNIAIITGASSGIGEQYLRHVVLNRSADGNMPVDEIWAIARRTDRLQALKAELDPVRIRVFSWDLTEKDALDDLQQVLATEKPVIRLLIHSAGIGRTGRFETNTRSEIHAMISLNCSALAEVTGLCLPYMIPAGDAGTLSTGPRIVHVASTAGLLPQPGFAVYAASKSFVISFSRALSAELRHHNIAVTTVCPGPVETDFVAVASGIPGARSEGFKALFVVDPGRLAAASLRASRRGRGMYVYGFSQKALHVLAKLLPVRVFTAFMGRLPAGN